MEGIMFTIERAREMLCNAGVFYYNSEEELKKYCDDDESLQVLNMNDVWGWACADCEEVSDDELPELATLFFRYGFCGVLYWVSKKRNNCRSEFYHYNRMIDFVEQEEKLRSGSKSESEYAYKDI